MSALRPIAADLQDGWTRQAAVREQHRLVKYASPARLNGERDARNFRKPSIGKRKRHKCGRVSVTRIPNCFAMS